MSFPKYPKYKDSGVKWLGKVPEHWEALSVRRLAQSVQTGMTPSPDHIEGESEFGLAWYTPGDFGNSLRLARPSRTLVSKYATSGDAKVFPPRCVLIVSIGATLGKVGFSHCSSSANQQINAIIPGKKVDGYFLAYSLSVKSDLMRFLSNASTIGIMNQEKTKEILVAIPPLPEQRAIASFLDRETSKIDALVAEQPKLIELLKEKRQAVISHAVTKGLNPDAPMKDSGIEWLGMVPEHWRFGPLKRFCEVADCKHITVPFLEIGYPVASVMEVREFELNLSRVLRTDKENFDILNSGDRQPQKGDVIYCRNTANTGTSAYVNTDEPICIGQDVVLIKSRLQNGRFLNYILHGPEMVGQLAQYMVGSTFKRINVADIRELIFTCAPKNEQDQIVKFLDARASHFDTLIAEAERAIDLLQERRTALISAAVTGKIDVRFIAEPAVRNKLRNKVQLS